MSPAVDPELQVLQEMCRAVVAVNDDASVDALATQIVRRYQGLDRDDRSQFFRFLLVELAVDRELLDQAIATYQAHPTEHAVVGLARAVESPRQRLFRSINTAPSGTAAVLDMRADVLELADADLEPVEADLEHLLSSWFNRGFLVLETLSWDTAAGVLEKLIEYEAVHEIRGWNDLQRRLAGDRRCLAYFHPALPGEPLIFVEVALTRGLASSIRDILYGPPVDDEELEALNTAIFYSITNCQAGLRGVSFGASLIKRAMATLTSELPHVRRFATLSPVPGLRSWLETVDPAEIGLDRELLETVATFDETLPSATADRELRQITAYYLLRARRQDGYPVDPVARFHLNNGARLSRVLTRADTSAKGLAESWGVLVNYVYSGEDLAANHEAYVNAGQVAASYDVQSLI
jgi:malonyl-CoA decarboxylase